MMIDNYMEILEQEYHRVCSGGRNILLVRYNNEFSFQNLEIPEQMFQGSTYVYVHEFDYRSIQGPLEPFLNLIKAMIDKYGGWRL